MFSVKPARVDAFAKRGCFQVADFILYKEPPPEVLFLLELYNSDTLSS